MGNGVKYMFLSALILFGLNCPASAEVIVNYFHTTVRCETCLMIEQVAENILEQEFAQELQQGTLARQPVNVDLKGNRHFIEDFSLGANELLIRDGQELSRFDKVPDTWHLINDYEKFKSTLTRMIRKVLQDNPKTLHAD